MKVKKAEEADVDSYAVPPIHASEFSQALEAIALRIVGRIDEIEAVKLCLLAKAHLMLEGQHGIAKSMFADSVFDCFTNEFQVFSKQFMKGTQTDEIFGPMNADKYRKQAVWEHNVNNMLPTAHFAFLDEVYRASDMVLPSMMGILNERRFINGGVVLQCPLMMAIGTTNFTTESEELEAFHDRWLVKVKVKPLDSSTERKTMLHQFLSRPHCSTDTKISMAQLTELQEATRKVEIPHDVIEVYEELVSNFRSANRNFFVSDRRLCHALRLVQAKAVLSGQSEKITDPTLLHVSKYGVFTAKDDALEQSWVNVFQKVVGEGLASKREVSDLRIISTALNSLIQSYDPTLDSKAIKTTHSKIQQIIAVLHNQTDEETPKSRDGIEMKKQILQDCESFRQTLEDELSSRGK